MRENRKIIKKKVEVESRVGVGDLASVIGKDFTAGRC